MSIMTTLSIIICSSVIGAVFSFFMTLHIVRKLLHTINQNKSTEENKFKVIDQNSRFDKPIVTTPPRTNISDDFNYGQLHSWIMTQISLFKMYKEDKLLDFDSIFKEISTNIQDITNNPDTLRKWNKEYVDYLKDKQRTDELLGEQGDL